MADSAPTSPLVVVTGANGLVGSEVCRALVHRGARVRAVVRRGGTAPAADGLEEYVGEFTDPAVAREVVADADAVVATVHPMGSDRETQQRIGVEGTSALARAASEAGVDCFVHVSTAAVYDRSPGRGDVTESADLVGDDADDYAVTKRDTESALGDVGGLTGVLLRPPAILGPGESSVWNTLRPRAMGAHAAARRTNPEASFAWVHVRDLAALAAGVATGRVESDPDPEKGPVAGAWTSLNVAGGPATQRDYTGTVTTALGVDPEWEDGPVWTGQILADRARRWGWAPTVDLDAALAELGQGLAP